jgi:hypothetical protein
MQGHAREVRIGRRIDEVRALLAAKPNRWLLSFLRLATHRQAAHTLAYAQASTWYRLRPPVTQDGIVRARLVWWPHLDPPVFTWFRGDLCAWAEGDGSVLTIEGEMDGGDPDENLALLDELIRLLGVALDADQSLDG